MFNLTFSNFIISQIGGKNLENRQSEEDRRHKLVLNAIKSGYSFHTVMKTLVLYVGQNNEYCVVFTTEKKSLHDPYEPSTAIFWAKENELSMVNLSWIDIWHLKKDYLTLMEHYKERIDYSKLIDQFLDEVSDSIDAKV
jgi:hypothetical protein